MTGRPVPEIDARISIVVMTRDRVGDLQVTLPELVAAGAAELIVVDNGSSDGTVDAIRAGFPQVRAIALDHNAGVEARNIGVALASTPYVAFADDDSWWTPEGLARAADVLDQHPTIGAIIGHVVVEPGGRPDPVNALLRDSPVSGDPRLPGTAALGFLACAAMVRRVAYLDVGGFDGRFHFAGEEQLLAADLAAVGWELRYLAEVPVHHRPSTSRAPAWRRRRELRNDLWFLALRRPWATVMRRGVAMLANAGPADALPAAGQAVRGLPWILRERRRLPASVERSLRRLDAAERQRLVRGRRRPAARR